MNAWLKVGEFVGWRLHLSTQPVSAVQIISGDVPQVAIWDSRHNVYFYDLHDATPLGSLRLADQQPPADLNDEYWRMFVAELQAPNGRALPVAYFNGLTLHQSDDGRMRVYHAQERLILEVDGRHIVLNREDDGRFLISALDRTLGIIGAINDDGMLTVFQQHVRVGQFDLGLSLGVDARLSLLAPSGTGTLVVSDGEHVAIVDSAGRVQHQWQAHYAAGPVAASPNGKIIALADIDDNVIRIYDGELHPTHQKHAIDLIAEARQVQLLASLPGRKAALSAMDVSDDGVIIFALGGVVCVTRLEALDVLPQPRPLL